MSTARDQLYFDIFVTALEGGIGYWSYCSKYQWQDDEGDEDVLGFRAMIVEDDDDLTPYAINRSTIARGYDLACHLPWSRKLAWSTEPPPMIIDEDTDWDLDAGDADLIVQLGLFGEVVYG